MATTEILPSLATPTERERASLTGKLQRERGWYHDAPRFMNLGEIAAARAVGDLVELDNDERIQRIRRFESGVEGFIPLLTERAYRAAQDLAELWQQHLPDMTESQRTVLRMAVTSMVRPQDYQDLIAENSQKLAAPDSTHCTGNAFDVDVSAYYHVDQRGGVSSVSDHRRHEGQRRIGRQLDQEIGGLSATPLMDGYSSSVTMAILQAARDMHEDGAINLVEEFSDTENACLHIAVNPDY